MDKHYTYYQKEYNKVRHRHALRKEAFPIATRDGAHIHIIHLLQCAFNLKSIHAITIELAILTLKLQVVGIYKSSHYRRRDDKVQEKYILALPPKTC